MKFVAALALSLMLAGAAGAILPPQHPPPPPNKPPIISVGGGSSTTPPPPNSVPEPSTLIILGTGLATAGAYRMLQRRHG